MALKSTEHRYGAIAITLHWLSALLIAALLILGFASALTADAAAKAALLRLHVPLGLTVLALTVLRLGWWLLADHRPPPPAGTSAGQHALERAVHALLYIAILAMGISGIGLMALSGAARQLFFGAPGPLPEFSAYAPLTVHLSAAIALMALASLHIAAALYHQAIRRDRLLARMGLGG